MRFVCQEHGEQDQAQHNGYSLGHHTGRDGPNELDLEDIHFVFDVETNELTEDGVELELSLASHDAHGSYLDKFADWQEKVTEAAESRDEHTCPKCGRLMAWLAEGEEAPWDE